MEIKTILSENNQDWKHLMGGNVGEGYYEFSFFQNIEVTQEEIKLTCMVNLL